MYYDCGAARSKERYSSRTLVRLGELRGLRTRLILHEERTARGWQVRVYVEAGQHIRGACRISSYITRQPEAPEVEAGEERRSYMSSEIGDADDSPVRGAGDGLIYNPLRMAGGTQMRKVMRVVWRRC